MRLNNVGLICFVLIAITSCNKSPGHEIYELSSSPENSTAYQQDIPIFETVTVSPHEDRCCVRLNINNASKTDIDTTISSYDVWFQANGWVRKERVANFHHYEKPVDQKCSHVLDMGIFLNGSREDHITYLKTGQKADRQTVRIELYLSENIRCGENRLFEEMDIIRTIEIEK